MAVMTDFTLHPRLAADTFAVTDLALCRVLLMNDGRFPWLILVPRRPGAREIVDLAPDDRRLLADETDRAAAALRVHSPTDKLNIAAIGNIVEQLHVHVVARRRDDAAWPGVVWGHGSAIPYAPTAATERLTTLKSALMAP